MWICSPCSLSAAIDWLISVPPRNGTIGFGTTSVMGYMRVPRPAARMTACRIDVTSHRPGRRVLDELQDLRLRQRRRVRRRQRLGERLVGLLVEGDEVVPD